ncbi:hypothetical protein HIM_07864 [Hirsutella minnesotensis 3608]|uniref:Uncharacterized protein n=1 Tax=Hirsutella minnesotensis 3608 TaxID=1043627 RepID=A0A0F7ZYL3_9HYPO|nr:hypothetical protein HIM_07864 [Hirsutella minnesotensis 3608]
MSDYENGGQDNRDDGQDPRALQERPAPVLVVPKRGSERGAERQDKDNAISDLVPGFERHGPGKDGKDGDEEHGAARRDVSIGKLNHVPSASNRTPQLRTAFGSV